MKTWVKNLTVLSFLLAIIVAGGVCNSQAADFGHGHKLGADLNLISSLNLSAAEQAGITSALSTYGPAVKTAWQQLRADKKQLKADLSTVPPVAATVGSDLLTVTADKAALKTARGNLYTALYGALSPANQTALQTALTTQFQKRLPSKMGHILFGYARYLSKQ